MKRILKVDPKIRAKREDLIAEPVIIRVNKFDDESAKKFAESFEDAHNTGQEIIPVVIDSYGGEVYSLLAMMGEIDNSTLPVATVAMGKSMSCGSLLFSCGNEGHRYMDSNAALMIHPVSSFTWGKVEDIKADASETERLHKYVYKKMAKNCGHKEDYFLKLIDEKKQAEWYLTAKEAKKHNLVNHIQVPHLETTITVNTVVI